MKKCVAKRQWGIKQNISEGEKISWKCPISSSNYDPSKLWSTDIFTDYESPHPVFSESVKILGAQMKKKKPTKLPFEIVWSKTLVREKAGVGEGKNLKFWYFTLI